MKRTRRTASKLALLLSLGFFPSHLQARALEDDFGFWRRFLQQNGSLSTATPTESPTPQPSQAPISADPTRFPVATPTDAPTDSPTEPPTAPPTLEASDSPTMLPVTSPPTTTPVTPTTSPITPTEAPIVPTTAPTFNPTSAPTSVPTSAPIEPTSAPIMPTASPIIPTAVPTSVPTMAPISDSPTVAPVTDAPTMSPVVAPSSEPSSSPTIAPIPSPTNPPVQITSDPTLAPVGVPVSPSTLPSMSPSDGCSIEVVSECFVQSGALRGRRCDDLNSRFPVCTDRPTRLTLKLLGGGCEGSMNVDEGFACVDTSQGPPPSVAGQQLFVLVTDAKGTTVYHRDFVAVGDMFNVTTPASQAAFPDFQRILIFSSDQTGDPSNLLQEVLYASSCDSRLQLKSRLGASLVAEFENPSQGVVRCIVSAAFSVNITVPDGSPRSVELTELTVFSNNGMQNLNDLVENQIVSGDRVLNVDIPPFSFDLTSRLRITFLASLAGLSGNGQMCMGDNFSTFLVGNPEVPLPPSVAPSVMPSGSPRPSIDNTQLACTIGADVDCICVNDQGDPIGPCSALVDPATIFCTGGFPATALSLRYLGTNNSPNDPNVIVRFENGATGLSEETIVGFFEEASVGPANLGSPVTVTTFLAGPNNTTGNQINTFELNTSCSDDSLRLKTVFGPLELSSFENALGPFSDQANVHLRYTVSNQGQFDLIAEVGDTSNNLIEPRIDRILNDTLLEPGQELLVLEENRKFDLGGKIGRNESFVFALNATGRSVRSGLACNAFDQLEL